jgi:hypothetical protein
VSSESDNRRRGPRYAPGVMRDRVADGLQRGLTVAEIAFELNIVKSTVCYHARRLGKAADSRFARRYDWSAIQRTTTKGTRFDNVHAPLASAPRPGTAPCGSDCWSPDPRPRRSSCTWWRDDRSTAITSRRASSAAPQGASLRTLWDRRLARQTTFDVPAPSKWGRRRQQAREPSAALPELP